VLDHFRRGSLRADRIDKWRNLGDPLPGTVDAVRELMKHAAFDIKNPNRVRALIGAFSANHLRFHAQDGAGYRLVAEVIGKLDAMNPLVAARMAGAFEAWRRYDAARQAQARAELERLAKLDGLSSNLFEVVTKMLG
jgi:aminopeptidase N